MAEYTEEFLKNLREQRSKDAAAAYLQRVHGSELAVGRHDIESYEAMDANQRLQFMVQMRRGSNIDIFATTVAMAAAFGAGVVLQNWFPYQWQKVPILPTLLGGAAWVTGTFFMRNNYGMRSAVALSGVTFALGGGTLGRQP
jgi:hypothetical protein